MSFRDPLMLAGLAVMVLPVVLHLLGRATAKPRPWGATMFLTGAAPPLHAGGAARQRLLLLSRVGLLAALALAFARPARSAGPAPGCELVIVIDTSPPMGLFDSGIGRLDRAKSAALHALATLKPGDTAALVTQASATEPTPDLERIAARVTELSVTRGPAELAPAMESVIDLLAAASPRVGRCIVIGDLSGENGSRALAALAGHVDPLSPLLTLNLGRAGGNDVLLHSLKLRSAGPAVVATVGVTSTAAVPRLGLVVGWSIDQVPHGQSHIDVSGNGAATAVSPPLPVSPGRHLVSAALEGSVPSTAAEADVAFECVPSPLVPRLRPAAPLRAGEPLAATILAPVDAHSVVVATPDGRTDGVYVHRFADHCDLQYRQTQTPGVYRLSYRSGGSPKTLFFVVEPAPVLPTRQASPLAKTTAVDSSEQLAQALVAARPVDVEFFAPAMAMAIALLAAGILLELPPGRGCA